MALDPEQPGWADTGNIQDSQTTKIKPQIIEMKNKRMVPSWCEAVADGWLTMGDTVGGG